MKQKKPVPMVILKDIEHFLEEKNPNSFLLNLYLEYTHILSTRFLILNRHTGWVSAIPLTEMWLINSWKVTKWHSCAIQSTFQTFQLTFSWLNDRGSSYVKSCFYSWSRIVMLCMQALPSSTVLYLQTMCCRKFWFYCLL